MTVADALAAHYAAHGLPGDGGATDAWFRVRIGPMRIRLPNPPARRRAVFFHDVNHVITGYNTAFSDGEMVIAGFEVGAGCGRFGIAWFINLVMMALGVLIRPRALYRAFARGRNSSSIYRCADDPHVLRARSVAQLKEMLALDRNAPRRSAGTRLQFVAWTLIAWSVTLATTAASLVFIWGIGVGVKGLASAAWRAVA
jgi:hypothetical protein